MSTSPDLEHVAHLRFLIITIPVIHGWGNRLPSLVTGAILAIITNRTIAIRSPLDLDEYLRFSFPWKLTPYHDAILANLSTVTLSNGHWPDLLGHDFRSPSYATGGPNIVEYMSGDYHIPILESNPHLRDFFDDYFPGGEVYSKFWRYIFKPSRQVGIAVRNTLSPFTAHYVIGVQIRTVKGLELGFKGFDATDFFNISMLLARSERVHGKARFFIASDSRSLYLDATSHLGSSAFWVNSKNIGASRTSAGNPGTEFSGIVDLFVLSRCDDLVISYASSYGWLAAALAGKFPIYIYPKMDKGPKHFVAPKFYRALTSEPCMWAASEIFQAGNNAQKAKLYSAIYVHTQCHPQVLI